MADQESQFGLLVNLFQQLEASIKEDRKETNQHLEKLRDNLHNLANDIHGVATLSQMQRDQIKKLETKHDTLEAAIHARIDRNVAEIKKDMHDLSEKFSKVNEKVTSIKPSVDLIGEIKSAFIKWLVPILCAAVMIALGANYFKGG